MPLIDATISMCSCTYGLVCDRCAEVTDGSSDRESPQPVRSRGGLCARGYWRQWLDMRTPFAYSKSAYTWS